MKTRLVSHLSNGVAGGRVADVVPLKHRQSPSVDGDVLSRGQEVQEEEHAGRREKESCLLR